jgi:hypothetical protein
MTDGHPTDGHLTDGHLTDEQLSSHLDGVADPDIDERVVSSVAGHLASCARCRERLAALGVVRERLQEPVPRLATEVRAASIAAVLRSAAVADGGAPRTAADEPSTLPRRRPQVLVGVAAAVLVLGAAIGVPVALSGKSPSANSEASGPAARRPAHTQNGSASATATDTLPDQFGAVIANLGTVDSVGALRSKVAALVPHASAAAPPTTGSATPTTGPMGAAATPAKPAPMATAATPGPGSGGAKQTDDGQATASQLEHCLAPAIHALPSATHAAGPARSVQSVATATFKGTPALVYVLAPASGQASAGGPVGSVVVVTARATRADCRVLGTTQL